MESLRVLTVIGPLVTGGAEKLLIEYLPILKKKGINTDLAILSSNYSPFIEILRKQNIKIIQFNRKNPYNPLSIFKLRNLIKKYDIVHAHLTPAQVQCRIASVGLNINLITTEHSTTNRRSGYFWGRLFDIWLYNKYKSIIACSNEVKSSLDKQIRTSRKIKIINNGIVLNKYENASPIITSSKKDVFTVIMVGRLKFPKDQETIIKAINILPENFEFIIVGDGPNKERLLNLIKVLGLEKRIRMVGNQENVEEWLKSTDLYIHASHYEGLPLSIIEAMAAGLPIVASDVKGIRNLVKDNGVLFQDANYKELADIILDIYNHPTKKQLLISQSKQMVSNFDINLMVDEYINTYKNINFSR